MVSYINWYKLGENGKLQFYVQKITTRQQNTHIDFVGSLTLLRAGTDPGDPYSYTLTGVDQFDGGFYSCTAGNILGESVETAFLQISGADRIVDSACIGFCLLFTALTTNIIGDRTLLPSVIFSLLFLVTERIWVDDGKS